ncbi:Phage Tail Protein X [Photorhabdus australis subsp. thailandensis]|uniref:Phage Tail Protein X n=1 Tax=Photorhabdus australis subsp. thailandensis TaxID=2805096 RepID=A0A1C0U997_9GAMM|nr:tail protein X [Photorhabdus australis]OCQ54502.1 Phage Tail Protein X [Photorhabdus australis subsp. thailandensis]
MKIIAHQNDTVDALCWRHYGRTQGMTERVLEANPGLVELIFKKFPELSESEYSVILPHGTEVEMPEIMPTATKPILQLWD